jgi:hypothetical protein
MGPLEVIGIIIGIALLIGFLKILPRLLVLLFIGALFFGGIIAAIYGVYLLIFKNSWWCILYIVGGPYLTALGVYIFEKLE